MQVAHSLADLSQLPCSFGLIQFLVRLYDLVKRAFLHILHQDVEIHCIMEEPIKFNHVRMGEEETDLQFLDELLQHETNGLFLDLLYSQDESCFLVSCRKDLTEPALPLTGA